jgi:hypothetical protein
MIVGSLDFNTIEIVQNKISRNPQRYKHIKINKPYFGDAI